MSKTYSLGWRLSFIVVGLVFTAVSASCSTTATDGVVDQSAESSSTDVFVDYTNDEFGFTAQFPAKQGEDTASWGDRYGSSFTVDSFDAPPGYDPTVQGIAIPRTVLRVHRPDDWPREIGLSEVYEERQLEEMLSSSLESELPPLLMQSTADLHPAIEFALKDGHPSATTVFPLTSSEGTIWCYVTVVYQDDGDTFSLAGIRETESDAIAAEASFRLLDAPITSGVSKSAEFQIPDGAIAWTDAGKHVGETVTVFGPAVASDYDGESEGRTYIDIGAPYPDPGRVSIVVWGEDRDDFTGSPEEIYLGRTISVTGELYIYGGACKIEVRSPSQVRVLE